jgi:glycosyltransferase involved in cell wall biosynthesis
MKILFVITGLSTGGAEMMLLKLLTYINRAKFTPVILSLTDRGDLAKKFEDAAIKVYAINMRKPTNIFALLNTIKEIKPDLIQSFMYHSDFFAAIASYFLKIPLAWNIRNSNLDRDKTKLTTILIVKLCAILSKKIPKAIVTCSEIAKEIHINLGYDPKKFIVIPNGFELEKFAPNLEFRKIIREQLKIDQNTKAIALIARFDPLKNHLGFIDAAEIIAREFPRIKFVLAGKNIDENNAIIMQKICAKNLRDNFILLGQRNDINKILAAVDLYVSPSHGEAFANVIGEAMACAVPCAASDAGDSRIIIGGLGKIAPTGDMNSLANAAIELLNLSETARKKLGEEARERVIANYDIKEVIKQYENFYERLLKCAA